MKKTVAVLEGDGIGPEIVRESLRVLRAIETRYHHVFELLPAPFGASAFFSHGTPFPEGTRGVCDRADVIIKGPVGLAVEQMERIPPEHRPEAGAILPLRKRYDTFANLRPVRLPPGLLRFSPLRPELLGDGLDILMIRELVGGIYFGEKTEGSATGMKYSKDECVYTESEVRRIAAVAFQEARRRHCVLTNVHKANVLATSRFWKHVVEEVGKEYPDVSSRSMLVDNAAFQLVTNPTGCGGVMLLENMQGDILTDQAGGLLGSLGLMPSACIGPDKSYVEPAHGSAPDIAGRNVANPCAMIGSIALMLERILNLPEEAQTVWDALFGTLERGFVTRDLARGIPGERVLSCSEFGDRVARAVEAGASGRAVRACRTPG